jgi:ribosomal protein L40E
VKLNDIGVQVEDFVLAGIKFTDEFKGQRAAFFEEENRKKDEKIARREKEREQRAEVDMIASIAKATQPATPAGTMPTPFAQNEAAPAVKYCMKCGAKLPGDAAFCSVCGYKF